MCVLVCVFVCIQPQTCAILRTHTCLEYITTPHPPQQSPHPTLPTPPLPTHTHTHTHTHTPIRREERQRLQSKTLEALFEALFRVIKHAANSAALTVTHAGPLQPSAFTSKFPLLRVALEGLTKYAHVIDVDYFESLLTVLTSLVNAPRLPPTEKLCVLLAASQLLRYVCGGV